MNQKALKTAIVSVFVFVFSTALFSQQAVDRYGFGERAFLVKSALGAGKSANGFWDVPGKPKKINGNLTDGRKVKKMAGDAGVGQGKGGGDDRLFSFRPGQCCRQV